MMVSVVLTVSPAIHGFCRLLIYIANNMNPDQTVLIVFKPEVNLNLADNIFMTVC